MRSLAEAMSANGHQISHSVISQIENGARRIDVDELAVLASYTDTSVTALLTPHSEEPTDVIGSAITPGDSAAAIVARTYKSSPIYPDWVEDAIDTATGSKWRYMHETLTTLDRLRESLGTDDIEMLMTVAAGLATRKQVRHSETKPDGND